MPITEHQRALRRRHLGASDTPALLGVSPYSTPADIYWSKREAAMNVEPDRDSGNDAMALGNFLEPALLSFASASLAAPITANQFRVWESNRIFSASFDGLLTSRNEAVEIKTSGVARPLTREEHDLWGDSDTDQIPDHVQVQCQHQIMVGELDRVWVFALLPPRGIVRFRVEPHEAIIEAIRCAGVAFWRDHVEPGIPPPGGELAPLELLRRVRRRPVPIALGEDALPVFQALREAKAEAKEAEAEVERRQRELLSLLGDAEAATFPGGAGLTFKAQTSRRLDVARLKAERPEIAADYETTTESRVLRLSEPKGQKTK